jgi:nucleotide-binding universal stress UspA family protein
VEDDSAAAGLLAAAEREHADLIVIGAHGHGSVFGRLLGATAYKISHRAKVPVVIVPVPPEA